MPIYCVEQDIAMTNEQKAFRRLIGSTNFAKYPYCWRQSVLAVLTYFKNGLVSSNLVAKTRQATQMDFPASNVITLLNKAIAGNEPHYVYREYANKLPDIVHFTHLKVRPPTRTELECFPTGRPPEYVFYYPNPEAARNFLMTKHDKLVPLFALLDKSRREGNF